MSKGGIQSLPGFRELYPEDCAIRNYVFDQWRQVAHRYGFVEYEGPVLEPTDLYRKKSGDEIDGQLFCFTDRGEREVAMRPELTPTLARMVSARQRDYKKPIKWYGIGQFFRYEKPQKGRTREFYQFNCDVMGETSPQVDAELVAMAIDLMRGFGFTSDDFFIRLSDRNAWLRFMEAEGMNPEDPTAFLQVIDKWEREKPEKIAAALEALGTSREAVEAFMGSSPQSEGVLAEVLESLEARGMADFVKIDLSIVRGLAYYTGVVFEIFDQGKSMRAIAGGGRYDTLCELISDGKAKLPAAGFAMGDVVIADLIRETPQPNSRMLDYLGKAGALDAYVVVADEDNRAAAIGLVQKLRSGGLRVDFPLTATKVGKQFQTAEQMNSRVAVVIGREFPEVKVKNLLNRDEQTVRDTQALEAVRQILDGPETGPLMA